MNRNKSQLAESSTCDLPGFFFLHTHCLPHSIDSDLVIGTVLAMELSPDRFASYYGSDIHPPKDLRSYLQAWPQLRLGLNLVDTSQIVLAVEGIGGNIDLAKNLDSYHALGLRVIQPYHWVNVPYFESGRLTRLGRELLHRMNDLDVIMDTSHMYGDTLSESLDVFRGKVMASHVVLRDLLKSATPRANSLSGQEITLLAQRSALIGVPFLNDLVSPGGNTAAKNGSGSIDDILAQVLSIMAIAGPSSVGFGPDYFEFKAYEDKVGIPLGVPDDLDKSEGLVLLYDRLVASGLTSSQVAAVISGNAKQFFGMQATTNDSNITESSGSYHISTSPWTFQQYHGSDVDDAARRAVQQSPTEPTHAWISLSTYCNLSCLHCRRHYREILDADKQRDIPQPLWEAITEEIIPGLHSLILGGNNNSEVTCARRFPDIVNYLVARSDRPSHISIQTNGSTIADHLLEALIGINTVFNFSVEGGSTETTARIRGLSLDVLCRRIEHINILRNQGGSSARIVLSFTAMRSNIAELPDLVECAERKGVDEVNVMFLLPATEGWNHDSCVHDISGTNNIIESTYRLCDKWHVELVAPLIRTVDRDRLCTRPWHSISVSGNGDVRFCCLADSPCLGNLLDLSFADIWRGRSAAVVRANVNSFHAPEECGACVLRNLPIVSAQSLARKLAHYDR